MPHQAQGNQGFPWVLREFRKITLHIPVSFVILCRHYFLKNQ